MHRLRSRAIIQSSAEGTSGPTGGGICIRPPRSCSRILGFAAVQAIRAEISDVMAIGCLSQGQLRLTMTRIKTINLELDLPTLDEARRKVIAELRAAKREGVRVLKVIHGYGSTGKGGRLCVGLRKSYCSVD
jgi:hypothetical protein